MQFARPPLGRRRFADVERHGKKNKISDSKQKLDGPAQADSTSNCFAPVAIMYWEIQSVIHGRIGFTSRD